jgi:hypothetical protein
MTGAGRHAPCATFHHRSTKLVKLRTDAAVGDAAAGDSGRRYPLAVRPGEGAGGGSTDVAGPSPAGLMWARGGADRAGGQFVASVAAGLDSSVMPALEEVPGCGRRRVCIGATGFRAHW